MKKFLILALSTCILASTSNITSVNAANNTTEYYNIVDNSQEVKENEVEYCASTGVISGAGSGNSRAYNYGVAADYIDWNVSYVFSQKIRAYAKTTVTGLNIFDPVPDWTISVKGNLYKNGHYYNGAPLTKGAQGDGSVRSNTPYVYDPVSGDGFTFYSYHKVYDYYGTCIWDNSHVRNKTY